MRARQGCSADGAARFEGGLGRYRLPHETRVPESLPKHPGSGRKENERKENERNERPSPQSTNVEHAPPSNTAADGLGARHPLAAAPSTTRSCPGAQGISSAQEEDRPTPHSHLPRVCETPETAGLHLILLGRSSRATLTSVWLARAASPLCRATIADSWL